MNSTAISLSLHAARNINAEQKKRVTLAALTDTKTITQIAQENSMSRKFVRGQKTKVADAIFNATVKGTQAFHVTKDLSGIHVTANDELFHRDKPILTGIDTRSLYSYLLIGEDHRDEDY